MKINNTKEPVSSFLSVEKDAGLIMDRIFANKNLQKLLYYNTPDALYREALTEEQMQSLIDNNIKFVPKIKVDKLVETYLLINFDAFQTTYNPEFRDNIIEFDIICHVDQWMLRDFKLRHFRIAAELDSMLDKKHLTNMGQMEFLSLDSKVVENDEFAGMCLRYRVVHGGEDKYYMPNPNDEANFLKNFMDMPNFQ